MKLLRLKGKNYVRFARIDDKDFNLVNKYHWRLHNLGYAISDSRLRSRIWMHRLIMNTPNGLFTDHINGDKLDNRRVNLRICSNSQNHANKFKQKGNYSSKYKGVFYDKWNKYWVTTIYIKNKGQKINGFKTEHQAALCYDLWAADVFGEFARLNFQRAI